MTTPSSLSKGLIKLIIILAILFIIYKLFFIVEYLPRHGWCVPDEPCQSQDWICWGVKTKTGYEENCKSFPSVYKKYQIWKLNL